MAAGELPLEAAAARARLAESVARYQQAKTRVDRVNAAMNVARGRLYDQALPQLSAAEEKLAAAREKASALRVAALLGEAVDDPLPMAERGVGEAAVAVEAVRADLRLLEGELAAAERRLALFDTQRRETVNGVVVIDSAALVAAYRETTRRLGELALALLECPIASHVWDDASIHGLLLGRLTAVGDLRPGLAQQWRSAIEALADDADAPLPVTE
jgi:hypothetical protein